MQYEQDVFGFRRSTVFATNLAHLSLQYCDLVNDTQLALLVLAARDTLEIINYYSERVAAMKSVRKA